MNNFNPGQEQRSLTTKRKDEHIDICLEQDVQGRGVTNGFERYRFVHNAVPEINFKKIGLESSFLSKKVKTPFLISSMTGGTERAWQINQRLAEAAEARGWMMGLGSMRAALEHSEVEYSFKIRALAPTIPIIANIGAVQLNYGYGQEQCLRVVDMVEADALVLHLNSMQEVFQPEGDTDFSQLLKKIEELSQRLPVPLGVKEVGWGIAGQAAELLAQAGVQFIDVAGAGGTSWSQVEKYRAQNALYREMAETFAGWGNPTAECVKEISQRLPSMLCIASGGITNGLEAAKALALGAGAVGFGRSLLASSIASGEELSSRLEKIELELKIAMFGIGALTISELRGHSSLIQL